MSESKNFEMRTYEYSDEIKSIIGKPPSKFVKYGSLATFIMSLAFGKDMDSEVIEATIQDFIKKAIVSMEDKKVFIVCGPG